MFDSGPFTRNSPGEWTPSGSWAGGP